MKCILAALLILIALSGSAAPAVAVNWHEGPAQVAAGQTTDVNWNS